MKYWFKILIHCKKNKAFNFLLHLFLMKYFSLFSDSVIQKEKSKISSLCPYLLCTSSPVVPVILKKSQTNQKLFRKWKLKECLFHLMIPPPSLFNIFASGVTVGISCYCIGEYLLFYLSFTIPISQWCMPTISVLENTEVNTGTTVLHYCIATRENDFSPLFFPNDSHLPKSHNLKSM